MRKVMKVDIDVPDAPGAAGAVSNQRPAITPAAKRWAELWNELDFSHATVLGRAQHVRADRFGPLLELIPQLFDLHRGRRFITIGIKYETGPGRRRETGSVAFGQFLNLAFADWAIADQLWEVLQAGDLGVSFRDLDVINGNFDRATKAADQYEKDQWIQRVWELKVRLEKHAAEQTQGAVDRIVAAIRSRPGAGAALVREGVVLPASLLGADATKEAITRFRINQGMYGDHTYFIDRPVGGLMTVHGIPPAQMFQRASELQAALTDNWLGVIGASLEDLISLTAERQGAALARAIESADVARGLNRIVGTFWAMWRDPIFSANAEFEVVTDHHRRAAKYMDILIQRTFRILLKQAIEEIGLYPYATLDRGNYWRKIHGLEEAVARTRHILHLYAHVKTVPAFQEASRERDRLVREFQAVVLGGTGTPPREVVASA
jgi:hypothetical protein